MCYPQNDCYICFLEIVAHSPHKSVKIALLLRIFLCLLREKDISFH